jgi:hypothetical protein
MGAKKCHRVHRRLVAELSDDALDYLRVSGGDANEDTYRIVGLSALQSIELILGSGRSLKCPRTPDGHDIRMQISMPTGARLSAGSARAALSSFESTPTPIRHSGTTVSCGVYCGHNDEHSAFITDQELNRAMRPIGGLAESSFNQMLSDTFGKVSNSRSRSGSESSHLPV